jgi:hypothetical protein
MGTASLGKQPWRGIADFRGDFDAVAALMRGSWSETRSQSLFYSAEFLESCLHYPGASHSLAPTLYDGDRPVGFVAGLPRVVRYKGRDRRVLVITLLTVASEFKNRGFGIALWNELVGRGRAAGFDGMVNYCVDGEAMNGMIAGCCQRLQLPVTRFHTIRYLSAFLWPKSAAQTERQPPLSEIISAFLASAALISQSVPLTRLWTSEEVRWQCSRAGALVAYRSAGGHSGVLTGYVMEVADANRTRVLLVDDVLWGSLAGDERGALITELTAQAAAQGARMAIVPLLGYADMEAFRAARFRPSARTLHGYLTLWNDPAAPEPVTQFYLDVF